MKKTNPPKKASNIKVEPIRDIIKVNIRIIKNLH